MGSFIELIATSFLTTSFDLELGFARISKIIDSLMVMGPGSMWNYTNVWDETQGEGVFLTWLPEHFVANSHRGVGAE